MSLFVCDQCHTIENTATGHYWSRNMDFSNQNGLAYCSACGCPSCDDGTGGHKGKWHKKWKQTKLTPQMIIDGAYKESDFVHTKALDEIIEKVKDLVQNK